MKPFLNISPEQFTYPLDNSRIAMYPATERDNSRLLIREKDGSINENIFKNISKYLEYGSHIFFNNSKVIPARLIFRKETGSHIEIFCIKPVDPLDYNLSFSSESKCTWECLIGNLKKFKTKYITTVINTNKGKTTLTAEKKVQHNNTFIIEFSWDNKNYNFSEILSATGITPLPPYIERDATEVDKERYNTVYSKSDGSVAAPTAGLHFTQTVLETLKNKNISCHEVTLHVGAGTFQPIRSQLIHEHEMHAEYFELTYDLVKALSQLNNKVACVGTTTVRTLESIYWLGVKLIANKTLDVQNLFIDQWEPYSLPEKYTINRSFKTLLQWLEKNNIKRTMVSTKIIIVPGYKFRTVNPLVTNFHQPGSTLLLLIGAFIGDSWKQVYEYGLKNNFRFLSYGDSSLLFSNE